MPENRLILRFGLKDKYPYNINCKCILYVQQVGMVEKSGYIKHLDRSYVCLKINVILTYLIMLNFTLFVLAIHTYKEKFLFWKDPLSFIGGTQTLSAIPNKLSWLIFSFGILLWGILCFNIYSPFSREDRIEHKKLKGYLFVIAGIGYFILLVPYKNSLFSD